MDAELRKITAVRWRNFLSTTEGKEGLEYVKSKAPRVTRGDSHGMVFDAGRVEGFGEALDRLGDILQPKEIIQDKDLEN